MYVCYFTYHCCAKCTMYGATIVFKNNDYFETPYDAFQDGDLRCNESIWIIPGTIDPRD